MAASVAFSNVKNHQTATVTVSGATPATVYTLQIVHGTGGTESHQITTDGSGNYSQTFVPQGQSGTWTVNLLQSTLTTVATATANCSGYQ